MINLEYYKLVADKPTDPESLRWEFKALIKEVEEESQKFINVIEAILTQYKLSHYENEE